MKILLVNPPNCGLSIPEERYGITSIKEIFRGEPLALETLAGNLKEHDVRILDLKVEPTALNEELERFAPDLVGLTAMTCEAQTVLHLARRIKQRNGTKVVIGGSHASCNPEFFNRPEVDWIVIGLGKQSLRELVDRLQKGAIPNIPGIAATLPGKPLHWTPRKYTVDDLVCSAAPRYDLVEKYRSEYKLQGLGLEMGLVASAAGCTYNCHFCCISSVTGNRYMTASTDSVIRDISSLSLTPIIRLVDANSFANPDHAIKLAEAIATSGIQKQYLADVRSDMVLRRPDLIKRWQTIGLRAVVIGFEEISNAALGKMNKENSAANNREAIHILHEMGVTIVGDFIINPNYTEQQFDQLATFVNEQQIDLPMYSVLTPLPGTALYRTLHSKINNHNLDYYTLTNAVLPTRLDEEQFYKCYASLLEEGHAKAKV